MDQLVDLPRYTWIRQPSGAYGIMRCDRLFAQHEIAMLLPTLSPYTQGTAADAFGAELCNALCEYLDRKEKDRAEAEGAVA